MLVDLARQVSNAYAQAGMPQDIALQKIRAAFDAEWLHPTGSEDEASTERTSVPRHP